jgi:archaetidylinositol phosphate synthase
MTRYERRVSGWTAGAERRLMIWIAERIPAAITPDMLTAAGVAGACLTFTGFVLSNWGAAWLALAPIGITLHWLGDSLDGTLARVRRRERERYGAFLDQSADVVSVGLMTIGLGLSPYMRLDVTLFALAAYLALAVMVQARAHAIHVYEIAHGGIGPTEGRLILMGLVVAMAFTGPATLTTSPIEFGLYDLAYLSMALWGVATFAIEVRKALRILEKDEPPPAGDAGA